MTNKYREPLSEEIQQEMQDSVEEKAMESEGFIRKLFSGGNLSSLWAANHLPFMFFVFCLAVIYISNRHYTENIVRNIDKLSNEVKVLSWEYKTLQADLMLKSTHSEIVTKVEHYGLVPIVEPPIKIIREEKSKR